MLQKLVELPEAVQVALVTTIGSVIAALIGIAVAIIAKDRKKLKADKPKESISSVPVTVNVTNASGTLQTTKELKKTPEMHRQLEIPRIDPALTEPVDSSRQALGIIGTLTDLLDKAFNGSELNLEREIHRRFNSEPPPKIAFIGFTGVGKTSTLNALFNAGLETSDTIPCTQQEREIHGDYYSSYMGSKGNIHVWDMPGMGEDIEADKKHLETYQKVLPKVDVAVWTIQANDRAMTPMQDTINKLIDTIGDTFTDKLMFAINKADTIGSGETDWNIELNIPSREQKTKINQFEEYVRSKILQILPRWQGDIVTYSATRRYRLDKLLKAMVNAAASQRQWLFNRAADVANPMDLINPTKLPYIQEQLRKGGAM